MSRRILGGAVLVLLCAFPATVAAQGAPAAATSGQDLTTCLQARGKSLPDLISACSGLFHGASVGDLRADLASGLAELKNPVTLNNLLGRLQGDVGALAFLKPLNLEFANLQSGNGNVLALRYNWSTDLRRNQWGADANHWGYQLAANARGTIASQSSANTENFVESGGNLALFRSDGGVLDGTDLADELNNLEDAMAAFPTFEALRASAAYRQFTGLVWNRLSTQTYVTFKGNFSYEADQKFERTQRSYGARLGLDVKAWNPESPLAELNVFDWPAAALRVLTGYDATFKPLGSAIPTLLAGLDQVDPTANPERQAVGDLATYPRVSLELAYRSPIARTSQGTAFLEIGYRAYRELGASDAIKAANLDGATRFFAALTGPAGLTASYASGRLPFDVTPTETWGLGFRVNF